MKRKFSASASGLGLTRSWRRPLSAEARARVRESAAVDRPVELGLALAGYKFIYHRQLKGGDLRSARATLDKLVALLGLAAPSRHEVLTLETIDRETARLEAELAAREAQTP